MKLQHARSWKGNRTQIGTYGFLGLLAYVPFFLSAPGQVAADTKQYLYLDPDRLLSRAWSMWDPHMGMGTVTHQNIGYLFPMGPYYWAMEHLGFPDWVAQRLWLGSITFAAGVGVLFLLRTLGWQSRAGRLTAALFYMLSPYPLAYTARMSAILLPWAALGWMLGFAIRSARNGGWRDPARFALVVLLVSGTNATSIAFVGIAPVLWMFHAVRIGEVSWRRALGASLRIGVLVLVTSLWWMAGLYTQKTYGLPILNFTETVKTVSEGSHPAEVMRGLGNWFFYGRDQVGPWITQSVDYTQNIPLLVLSFALPCLALVAAALVRWRHRGYFLSLIVTGTVIATGAHPYGDPSALGGWFKGFANGSSIGLALRSTPRAVPLVVLGMAVLFGAGIGAVSERIAVRAARHTPTGVGLRARMALAGVACALVIANLPAAWSAAYVGEPLRRPEEIPQYWRDAVAYLDAQGDETRVLELPGSDFSSYRWGNTVDPITPGLMDRPWVGRELIPFGSPASADLLMALDRRMQEGVLDPEYIESIAQMMGVGDVLLRSDLAYERYRTPRPKATWLDWLSTEWVDESREEFGSPEPNTPDPSLPLRDEIALITPINASDPPPVAIFPIRDALPIVRAVSVHNSTILSGDAEGLVDIGGGSWDSIMFFSASLNAQASLLRSVLKSDPWIAITDTNRRRARRWGTIRENTGYTERAGEVPLVDDPSDNRLDVFPGASDDTRTVTVLRGVDSVQASAYGNPVSYTPEDRPVRSLDGDALTAWRVGAFEDVTGQRLVAKLEGETEFDHLTILQPITGPRDRRITRAVLRFDGGEDVPITLTEESWTEPGQRIEVGNQSAEQVEFEIRSTTAGRLRDYTGRSAVGIAELGIPGVQAEELVRMPVDLVRALDGKDGELAINYLMTRLRANSAEPVRQDEELALNRIFEVPESNSGEFSLLAAARISPNASDAMIDSASGRPVSGVVASSSDRLNGSLMARSQSAIDGDPGTAWTAGFGPQAWRWIEYETSSSITFDHLDLQIVADGWHSVPTKLRIETGGEGDNPDAVREVEIPAIIDGATRGEIVPVHLEFPEIIAQRVRIVFEEVRPVTTIDYHSRLPIEMPLSVAELGIAGLSIPELPPEINAAECRDDLISIDGEPVQVTVGGDQDSAQDRGTLYVVPYTVDSLSDSSLCEGQPLQLEPGEHVLRAVPGRDSGIDIDQVALSSDIANEESDASVAQLRTRHADSVNYEIEVSDAKDPFWLVLAESYNKGWRATINGKDLGKPTLVDVMANGWLITPTKGDAEFQVHLEWTPQRLVNKALALSAASFLICLALALSPWTRRGEGNGPATHELPAFAAPIGTGSPAVPQASLVRSIAITLAIAAFGWLIADPWVGIAGGAIAGHVAFRPKWRVLIAAGPAICLGISGAYAAYEQMKWNFPATFDWPSRFDRSIGVTWLGISLLAADAIIEVWRAKRTNDSWRAKHSLE